MVVFLNPKANCGGRISGSWYKFLARAGVRNVSLGEITHQRYSQPSVIAIGGNSLDGLEDATAEKIVYFRNSVITHGNGPQVGALMVKYNGEKSLNECVAETQDSIGALLKLKIEEMAHKKGRLSEEVEVVVIPTRVIVDAKDPAFNNPTKYIGVEYSLEEVIEMGGAEKKSALYYVDEKGWWIKGYEGKPGVYRRVVASPKPLAIHPEDLARIQNVLKAGKIPIACGGGGVPFALENDGSLTPVDAVIDKDLASALLAGELRARELIISTGVKRVANDFGKPEVRKIDYMMLKDAMDGLLSGQYPPGSMGEKVEAVINALRLGVNAVLITHPELNWILFEGTLFTRGPDFSGRIHNLGVTLGNVMQGLTRRRYGLPKSGLQRWLVTDEKEGISLLDAISARLMG